MTCRTTPNGFSIAQYQFAAHGNRCTFGSEMHNNGAESDFPGFRQLARPMFRHPDFRRQARLPCQQAHLQSGGTGVAVGGGTAQQPVVARRGLPSPLRHSGSQQGDQHHRTQAGPSDLHDTRQGHPLLIQPRVQIVAARDSSLVLM